MTFISVNVFPSSYYFCLVELPRDSSKIHSTVIFGRVRFLITKVENPYSLNGSHYTLSRDFFSRSRGFSPLVKSSDISIIVSSIVLAEV